MSPIQETQLLPEVTLKQLDHDSIELSVDGRPQVINRVIAVKDRFNRDHVFYGDTERMLMRIKHIWEVVNGSK